MNPKLWIASIVTFACLATLAYAQAADLEQARELYSRTDYAGSLALLKQLPQSSAPVLFLAGQNHFVLGEYKEASEAFQKATLLDSNNSDYFLWLGRAYGRRAEIANPLSAALQASKARQHLERAVQLNPLNKEALADLFDFYLQAPAILGGGLDKAAAIARRITAIDAAEGYFALSQLADKKKEYSAAEAQLRRAVELAPQRVGKLIALAKFLAKQGRYRESDAMFDRAQSIAPNSPRVLFAKASTLVQERRNLEEARELLRRYIDSSQLTPDDPPRSEAEQLLRRADGPALALKTTGG